MNEFNGFPARMEFTPVPNIFLSNVLPEITDAAELKLMQELVNTYGKTWNLWQVDRGDKLPLGLPKLMMGFTADGQADPAMIAARDHELHTDTTEVKASHAVLETRPIADGADGWQLGPAFQIRDDQLQRSSAPSGQR